MTCAVLAPAGPNRSRVLASLYRDERSAGLAHFTILTKMFLDQIIRPSEIKGFEETLRPHQLARIAQSAGDKKPSPYADEEADGPSSTRTGPSTVLDRAVMEHNLLSCSKIYNNITFSGLGALLDLAPAAAETMARKMIEQKRLKGSIDQVERLIVFEAVDEEEGQGKAGGLGDVDLEEEDPGAPFTKQWDLQIRQTASNVSFISLLHSVISFHYLTLRWSRWFNVWARRVFLKASTLTQWQSRKKASDLPLRIHSRSHYLQINVNALFV